MAGKTRTPLTLENRLLKHCRRLKNGCLEWMGSTDGAYGVMRAPYYRVHRLAYILKNGEIPKGTAVLQTCGNPLCCEPKHLKLEDFRKANQSNQTAHIIKREEEAKEQSVRLPVEMLNTIKRQLLYLTDRKIASIHKITPETVADLRQSNRG